MNRRPLFLSMLCVTMCLQGPAHAANPYVTHDMLDITTLLPPPPAHGTRAEAEDLLAVLDSQAHASEARKTQALNDANENVFFIFADVLGASFAADTLPKTRALFAGVAAAEKDTVDAAKPIFARPRPWAFSPDVHIYTKKSKSGSYPSGHTAHVSIDAIILTAILPEKRRDIWARARDYADSRVIGGMHYPSDIAAGWQSGAAIAALMLQQPGFQSDMIAAKTELRAALGLSAEAPKPTD